MKDHHKLQSLWQDRIYAVVAQFQGLEGLHPGLWPLAPRILCGVSMVLIMLIAGWFFLWTAQWDELDAGRIEEHKQRAAFQFKVQQAQSLALLRQQKARVETQVHLLEQQLPGKAEMDALLADINQAGVGRGLQFELFKPGKVLLHDYYAQLPIDIRLAGSYHALASFISDVAHLPRIVTFDKIVLANLRDGVQTFDAVIHTFRYLDKEEAAARKKIAADKQKERK